MNSYQNQSYTKLDSVNALAYVENRHSEIVQLGQSVKEVKDLFMDVSLLVNEQGSLINNIEHNVEHAVKHVDTGVVQIKKASEYQSSSRQKLCCLAFFMVIILLIVVVVIVLNVGVTN